MAIVYVTNPGKFLIMAHEPDAVTKDKIVVTKDMIDRIQFSLEEWVGKEDDELCVSSIPSRQSLSLLARLIFFPPL